MPVTKSKLFEDAHSQYIAEFGNEPLPDHRPKHRMFANHRTFDPGCMGCQATERSNILRQKYGLSAPQLTEKERYVVSREERNRIKNALMRDTPTPKPRRRK